MLLLKSQSKVFVLSFGEKNFVQAPIELTHITNSIDDLLSVLEQDANIALQLNASIEILDSDGVDKNQQRHLVTPSVFLRTHLEPLPPVCAVVVITFERLNEQVIEALGRISCYDVARLLVCRRDDDIKSCITVINHGKADGALSLESTDTCDLVATIDHLRMRKAHQKQLRIAELVGFGPTSFLKDPEVMEFIDAKAAPLGAIELRLCLNPPGIVLIGHDFSPVFLMICDETYAQALREIALDIFSPSFDEPASGTSVASVAKSVRNISAAARWFFCELPYQDIPHQLL